MTEIRGLILPKDLDRFDTEVMEREVQALKVRFCMGVPCIWSDSPEIMVIGLSVPFVSWRPICVSFSQGTADDTSEHSIDTLSGNSQLSYNSNRVNL